MRRMVLMAWAFCGALRAQAALTPEPLSAWLYFKEIPMPRASGADSGSQLLDFVLDRETLDGAQTNLSDLRLYDSAGRETPYILQVRKGAMLSFGGNPEGRDADRMNARPASIWRVDLGGRIPIQRVLIMAGDGMFSRPFQLQAVDDPAVPVLLASGQLTRRENAAGQLAIEFPERFARRLRLTVTDDRNLPLSIAGITAQGAARQVVFDSTAVGSGPLRLYYGNPRAIAPRYDLVARLPSEWLPGLSRLTLGTQRQNPIYHPEPKPFSERSPWLVYVVLGAACAVLAAILVNLARDSRHAPVP